MCLTNSVQRAEDYEGYTTDYKTPVRFPYRDFVLGCNVAFGPGAESDRHSNPLLPSQQRHGCHGIAKFSVGFFSLEAPGVSEG